MKMKYTFYAISEYVMSDNHGEKKVLFKCKNTEENDCLTLSRFLPNQYGDMLMSYYIVSEDYKRIIELSYGRVVSILKFDED